jgi:hypothetical protein
MKLSEVKASLSGLNEVTFQLPNGEFVPVHFHVTEVGAITRHFIDCGGTERLEKKINFQLWEANDYDHRLAPQKLAKIIDLSIDKLGLGDLEVEVEYQAETIGKYFLDFNGKNFVLQTTQTACLAQDQCGIPPQKQKVQLQSLGKETNSCTPGGGCC